MTRVLVSFPTDPAHPFLHKHVVFVSWRLLADKRFEVTPIIPSHRPFENNLNRIVDEFIKGGFDYWLSIDADNPPTRNPLDLVALDLDIIGLPTPVWHYDSENKKKGERPIYYNGYDYVPKKGAYKEHLPRRGLQKVDAIGTGCFLIAERVFENKEMRKAPFLRQYDDKGFTHKGNDISFCEKARYNGFEVYCHYDYPCNHFVTVELNEVAEAFMNLYE